jgi:putative transposase
MLKALRYRLYPTKAQVSQLAWTLETCRQVYNSLVNDRKFQYEVNGKAPTWIEQKRAITAWKPSHPELSDVYSQVLQDVSKRVDLAFQAFFRRVKAGETPGYPRVKGDGYDSFTYPQSGFGFHQGKLRLSKIGDISIRQHRSIDGDIKTCTVRRINSKWFVCFSAEYEAELLPPSTEEVGLDVGLKTFASLSNGENIENPRFFRAEEKALAKAQRKLAKQKRGSRERKKARKVVSRIHERVRNRRHDFVHQTARRLVNRYGVIAVEKLNVKGMVTPITPKNHCLAKSISDASWSMFRSVLTNKAESAGRLVVSVNPAYTSQMCSGCGNIAKKSLSVRTHRCLSCGLVLDRDTNAAVNIKALGQYSLATLIA